MVGDPVRVARDADPAAQEAARRAIEDGLDNVHVRAFALVGRDDPGAGLAAKARAAAAPEDRAA